MEFKGSVLVGEGRGGAPGRGEQEPQPDVRGTPWLGQ